jgi:hypothetical protein
MVCERIPHTFGFDPKSEVMVLTPRNDGTTGARSLNIALQVHRITSIVHRITSIVH